MAIVIVTTSPSGPVHSPEDISNAVVEAFNNPRIFLTVIGISVLVTLAGGALPAMLSPVPFAKRLHLGRTRTCWWQDVLLVVASLAVGWTLTLLLTLLHLDRGGIIEDLDKAMGQMRGLLLAMGVLIIGVIGPLAEEVLFRGYVQTRLSERWGPLAAVLIAATLFGLLHFDLVHSPFAFGFGLALGYATERSGSIWPAVWAHMINNTVSVLLSASALAGPEQPRATLILAAAMAALAVVCVIVVDLKRPAARAQMVEGTHGTT
jgi:membrane protease YdiL (CAAX protease family)